jgi:uncharacterized protein YjbI with pentapeptide repeats
VANQNFPNLVFAKIRKADLNKALRRADLIDADLSGIYSRILEKCYIKWALFDSETIFPDEFNPDDHKMIAR